MERERDREIVSELVHTIGSNEAVIEFIGEKRRVACKLCCVVFE